MSQEAVITQLLPLNTENKSKYGYNFEPDELTVLNALIPEYVAENFMLLSVKAMPVNR